MKAMNLTIQRNIVVAMTVILAVLAGTAQVAAVEYKNSYKPLSVMGQNISAANQTEVPSAVFQSTSSTMMSSGSAYSANPTLGEDGTASAPSGPRRAKMDDPTPGVPFTPGAGEEQFPLGDAALPLMLLAGMFAFGKWIAKTKPLR